MKAVSNGRALPPRPSLLVGKAGDVEACTLAWTKLRPSAEDLLQRARMGSASAEELDCAVQRFRSLRESLVAAYVRDNLAIQVYEYSADMCLVARCWPEFLKSIAALTADLYPQQHQNCQQQQQQQLNNRRVAAPAGPSTPAAVPHTRHGNASEMDDGGSRRVSHEPGSDGCGPVTSTSISSQGDSSSRRGEMAAAHVLFLACAPSGGVAEAAAQLRNPLTLLYLASDPLGNAGCGQLMQFTVQTLSSLATGDWYAFIRLMEAAPRPSLRAVLEIRAPMVRRAGVRALTAAFRSLPAPVVVRVLGLRSDSRTSSQQGWQPIAMTGKAARVSAVRSSDEQLRPTFGLAEDSKALQAVLEDAAAAGVRGAQVALKCLSACWRAEDVGCTSLELCFRIGQAG